MDNLDTLKKLVSTRRTFSISTGLDCRDHQGYLIFISFAESSQTTSGRLNSVEDTQSKFESQQSQLNI